jgi:hypothetical protein
MNLNAEIAMWCYLATQQAICGHVSTYEGCMRLATNARQRRDRIGTDIGRWKWFHSGDGETAADAQYVRDSLGLFCPDDVATIACEMDYSDHEGHRRNGEAFEFTVISPGGKHFKFAGQHEATVEHNCWSTEDDA